ncbi:hypothetical protein EDB87DRAFT_1104064 [Lactarius vividus]|nr:hypothetical protein EDB87DRAFT_1104064 [Lactarius vividus]
MRFKLEMARFLSQPHINTSPHAFYAPKIALRGLLLLWADVELLPLPCVRRLSTSPTRNAGFTKSYHHPHCIAQTRVLAYMLISLLNKVQVQLRTLMRCSLCRIILNAHHAPIQWTTRFHHTPCASACRGPPALPRVPPHATCGVDGDCDGVAQRPALPLPVYNALFAGTNNELPVLRISCPDVEK